MKIWIQLCFKELWFRPQLTLFFLITAITGLLGLGLVQSLSSSLAGYVDSRASLMLGGDLVIEGNRPLQPKEIEALKRHLPPGSARLSTIQFVTMAGDQNSSRLIRITGIQDGWPLIGQAKFKTPISDRLPKVFATPDAATSFGLEVQDWLNLAGKRVQIDNILTEDPGSAFSVFGLAPRLYLHTETIQQLDLLEGPSRVRYEELIRLKNGTMESVAKKIRQAFRKLGPQSQDLDVETARQDSRQLARLSTLLSDWLGLTSAAVLLLAGAGLGYLFRTHLMQRTKTSALLRSLGASPFADGLLTMAQALILGLSASFITLGLLPLLLPWMQSVFGDFLPSDFRPQSEWDAALMILVVGTLAALMFCLPNIVAALKIRPWSLMSSERNLPALKPMEMLILGFFSLAGIYGLTLFLSRSSTAATIFTLATAGIIMLCRGLLLGLRRPAQALSRHLPLTLQLATRRTFRNLSATTSTVLAIAFACLLLTLVPELRMVLVRELNPTWNQKIPGLFLFDIQDEQKSQLQSWLEQQDLELAQPSPMIRARLRAINDSPFDSTRKSANAFTREDQSRQRFQRRTFNLSIRAEPSTAETIIEGIHWKRPHTGEGLPGISVEERFMERLGFELGDKLTFDIAGVYVEGKIVSVRSVRWNSFEPNFFVVFQPGVLEPAPKSWVGAIQGISETHAARLQADLLSTFGNISSVVVARITREVAQIAQQMLAAVETMSLLSLLCALAVLFAIGWHEGQTRTLEIGLMKALGNTRNRLSQQLIAEFFMLGLAGVLLGSGGGLALSLAAQEFILEQPLAVEGTSALILLGCIPPLTSLIAYCASIQSLQTRPQVLLADA